MSILGALGAGLSKIKNVNWSGAAKRVGSFAAKNGDTILGGIGLVQGARADAKAQGLENEALQRAQQLFDEKAPLRKLSASLLQQAPRRDLSSLKRDDGNPFARGG